MKSEMGRDVAAALEELIIEIQRRGDRMLDVRSVTEKTTLSRSRIFELERRGGFPSRRQITANKVGWLESEIDRWIAERPTAESARRRR